LFSIQNDSITILFPKSRREFLALWRNSSLVLTDSGGLQEETTALGIPCLFSPGRAIDRPLNASHEQKVIFASPVASHKSLHDAAAAHYDFCMIYLLRFGHDII